MGYLQILGHAKNSSLSRTTSICFVCVPVLDKTYVQQFLVDPSIVTSVISEGFLCIFLCIWIHNNFQNCQISWDSKHRRMGPHFDMVNNFKNSHACRNTFKLWTSHPVGQTPFHSPVNHQFTKKIIQPFVVVCTIFSHVRAKSITTPRVFGEDQPPVLMIPGTFVP